MADEYTSNFILDDKDEMLSSWVLSSPTGENIIIYIKDLFPSGKYCYFDVSNKEFGKRLIREKFPHSEKIASRDELPQDLPVLYELDEKNMLLLLAGITNYIPLNDSERIRRARFIMAIKSELDRG